MSAINLTQEDADALLAMEKQKADDGGYEYLIAEEGPPPAESSS